MDKPAAIWLCSDYFSCLSEELMFEVFRMIQLFFSGAGHLFKPWMHVLHANISGTAGTVESCCCIGIGKPLLNHVSHQRNCQFQKTDDFCPFLFLYKGFLVLFFLGKSEVCVFLTMDWIQTIASLTEQILIIENTKISHFVSCGWASSFPLGLYLFTVSDNWTVTHTLT